MNSDTREILAENMLRNWLLVWSAIQPSGHYRVYGTAAGAVASLENADIIRHRIVMDDGTWTIRGYFRDGSVATLFASE